MNQLTIVRISKNQHTKTNIDIELHSFSDQSKALKSLWGLLCRCSETTKEIDGKQWNIYNITISPTHLVNDKTDWDKEKIEGASQTILKHYPFKTGLPEMIAVDFKNKKHINMEKCICNQCDKEKNGTPEGICSNCGKFGKTFSPFLFNKKMEKFSSEEKKEAFKVIFAELSESEKFALINSSGVIDWYKKNCY